jgi:nucleotide sugar dehydrogenase
MLMEVKKVTKEPTYKTKPIPTVKRMVGQPKISIIGSGVVGKATGMGLALQGIGTLFHDINRNTLLTLQSKGYEITTEIEEVVLTSEVIFVCLPTPNINDNIDLRIIEKCSEEIGRSLKKTDDYVLIVFRSTMPPGTTRLKIIPILERYSGLKTGVDFGICTNPEFLREQSPLEDFLHPNKSVIGEHDKKSGNILEKLYAPLKFSIIRTDLDSAEMIKYTSNLFLASKISFFNEIFLICEKLGLDSKKISEVASLDYRIGRYGIYGGKPFGGMCLPKDLAAFVSYLKDKGIRPKLLEAVSEINKDIERYDKEKIAKRER